MNVNNHVDVGSYALGTRARGLEERDVSGLHYCRQSQKGHDMETGAEIFKFPLPRRENKLRKNMVQFERYCCFESEEKGLV